jgi:hypothetical protein
MLPDNEQNAFLPGMSSSSLCASTEDHFSNLDDDNDNEHHDLKSDSPNSKSSNEANLLEEFVNHFCPEESIAPFNTNHFSMTNGQTSTRDLNAHNNILSFAQHQPKKRKVQLDGAGVAPFASSDPNQPFQAGLITYDHAPSFTAQEERSFNSGVWTSDKLNTMQDFNVANASTQSQNESLSYNSIPQATYNFMGEMKPSFDSTSASVNNVDYVTAPFGMAGTGAGDQYFPTPTCYASSQPFGQNFNYPGSSAGMNVNTGASPISASNGSSVINSGQGISGGANHAAVFNIFNDASTKYDASNGVNFAQGNESGVDNAAVINDGSGIYAMSSATRSSLIQNPNFVNSFTMLHPSQTPMSLYATMPSMCSMAAGLTEGNEVLATSAFVNSNDPPLVLRKPKVKLADVMGVALSTQVKELVEVPCANHAAVFNIFNDASTKYDASNGVNFGQGNESGVDNVAVINDGSGIYAMSSAFSGQYDRDTRSSLIQNQNNLVNSFTMLHPSQTPMSLYATMPSMCSMAAGLTEGNEVLATSAFVNSTDPPLVLPRRTTTDRAPSKPKFALKLMEILSMRECQNALRWMPDGTCFCILNIGDLVEKVLVKHFKETKYSSFVSLFMILRLTIWCGLL